MMEFFAGCARLFDMTFDAALGLGYFKLLVCLLLFEVGIGLMRMALFITRKL